VAFVGAGKIEALVLLNSWTEEKKIPRTGLLHERERHF
jgi:hypothetical protein